MNHRIFFTFFLLLNSQFRVFSQSIEKPYYFTSADTSFHWNKSGLDQEITSDIKIVGLGEFTHGGKEVFTVKTSLIKYLIYKKEFKVILFEFPNIALIPIDDYLQNDKVFFKDLIASNVLATLSSSFRTVEIVELITVLKQYNLTHQNKVTLKGVDVSPTIFPSSIYLLQRYLSKYYPKEALTFFNEKQAVSDSAAIVKIEKWINLESFQPAPGFTETELEELRYDVKNAVDSYKIKGAKWHPFMRDSIMAENVKLFAKDQRTIVWAHNLHLVRSISPDYGKPNLGQYLNSMFGRNYYIILSDFFKKAEFTIRKDNQGSPASYIPKVFTPEKTSFARTYFKDSTATSNYLVLVSQLKNQQSRAKLNLIDVVGTPFSVSQKSGAEISWNAIILLGEVNPSIRF